MAVCAAPGGIVLFGTARFMIGLGIGAIVAAAGALAVECAPRGRSQSASALTWIGAAMGGLLGAALSLVLLPRFGPSVMFALGAVPLVTLVPALVAVLPESPAFLLARGRVKEANAMLERYGFDEPPPAAADARTDLDHRGLSGLFTTSRRRTTIVLGLLSALILLVIYGLSTHGRLRAPGPGPRSAGGGGGDRRVRGATRGTAMSSRADDHVIIGCGDARP